MKNDKNDKKTVPLMEKWEKMSTHRLLERYGMSELGMALSNSLKEERYPVPTPPFPSSFILYLFNSAIIYLLYLIS